MNCKRHEVGPTVHVDLRKPADGPASAEAIDVTVMNARNQADLGLHTSGFELVPAPSAAGVLVHVAGPNLGSLCASPEAQRMRGNDGQMQCWHAVAYGKSPAGLPL